MKSNEDNKNEKIFRMSLYLENTLKENVKFMSWLITRHEVAKIKFDKMTQIKEIRTVALSALITVG